MRSLIPDGLWIDFLRWRTPCAIGSALLVAFSILVVPFYGVRLGIDFVGGVEMRVRVLGDKPVGEGELRQALAGVAVDSVVRLGSTEERTFVVRLRGSEQDLEQLTGQVERQLGSALGGIELEQGDVVGARVGAEFRRDALMSIGVSFVLIGVYMAFRFDRHYVPGALIALLHDAILSTAAVVVCGLPLDFTVIGGILTVVGYSLNDTIVIYDRIRENVGLRTAVELERLIDDSLNETLSRTVLTAGTTLMTSLALLAFGGDVLRGFSLSISVGVVVGTYSTLFVAAPSLLSLGRPRTRPRPRAVQAEAARLPEARPTILDPQK